LNRIRHPVLLHLPGESKAASKPRSEFVFLRLLSFLAASQFRFRSSSDRRFHEWDLAARPNVELQSWPEATAGGFIPQYVDSLKPPVLWSDVVATITKNSGTVSVSVPATNAERFFRLKK